MKATEGRWRLRKGMPIPRTYRLMRIMAQAERRRKKKPLARFMRKAPGMCLICGLRSNRQQVTRHLSRCMMERDPGKGRRVRALRVSIQALADRRYWMQIEIPSAQTLADLDRFLRATWLECCGGHASHFLIGGQRLCCLPDSSPDSGDGTSGRTMSSKLYQALTPGMEFTYEYDPVLATGLVLKALGEHEMSLGDGRPNILARNDPPVFGCSRCERPAVVISGGRGPFPDCCFCESCAPTEGLDPAALLPVVDSPRTGICAYRGGRG